MRGGERCVLVAVSCCDIRAGLSALRELNVARDSETRAATRRLTAELAVPLLRVLDAGVVEHDELARVLLDLARRHPRAEQLQAKLGLGAPLMLAEAAVADTGLRGAVEEEREVQVVGAV